MDPTRPQPIRRFDHEQFSAMEDSVVNEVRVELDINDGQAHLAMLCLPNNLEAMVVGFLLGEGLLSDSGSVDRVTIDVQGRSIAVHGPFDPEALETLNRRWTWGSGCGGGGTSRSMTADAYQPVRNDTSVTPAQLLGIMHEFQHGLELWKQTGGVHACALTDGETLLVVAEDVGRHNAFDKTVGTATLRGIDIRDKFIITTGRLSAEIVSKAVACRVPMLVSRCAVTGLAVDLARRFGVTLVGFVRGKRFNVYTGYQRVQ